MAVTSTAPELPIVVVLEDLIDDERLAMRAFRTSGFELDVRFARDGEQAAAILGLSKSATDWDVDVPNLIISDLKMPKFNGDEILTEVRSDPRLGSVPFVIFSSSDETKDVSRCLEHGASAYCKKPIDFEEYIHCLHGILKKWLGKDHGAEEPDCVIGKSASA